MVGAAVRKYLALAAAAIAGLTACSVSTPDSAAGSGTPGPPSSASLAPTAVAPSGRASTPTAAPAGGTRAACELFNSLFADYQAVPAGDADGFEDIYLQAEDAKATVSGDLAGLFASLSLLAIDHSAAVDSGGGPAQESRDAVRDAVFANAGTCTAQGVTLRL